ncbi:hypothetical protein BGX34_001588 [Mortierella sp. NVP85]|nr:hypothetical protein BGX34_001588 [Mortierella sp. NVP85]
MNLFAILILAGLSLTSNTLALPLNKEAGEWGVGRRTPRAQEPEAGVIAGEWGVGRRTPRAQEPEAGVIAGEWGVGRRTPRAGFIAGNRTPRVVELGHGAMSPSYIPGHGQLMPVASEPGPRHQHHADEVEVEQVGPKGKNRILS